MADTVVDGVLEGTFTEVAASAAVPVTGPANILIDKGAAGDGTVTVEKSFDQGVTWKVASQDAAGVPATYTGTVGLNGNINEPEYGILYRLNCTVFVANIGYRIGRSATKVL